MLCDSVAAQVHNPKPPLPLPLHVLDVTVHGEKSRTHGSDVRGFIDDFDEFSNGFGTSQSGSASAASVGAGVAGRMSPAVATTGRSEARGGGPNPQGSFFATSGIVRAHAYLFYGTRIAEVDAPPFVIPHDALPLKLPVTVTVFGEGQARTTSESVSVVPWSQASGFAAALVAGLPAGKVEVCAGPLCGIGSTTDATFRGSFDFSFVAGQEIGVILEAGSVANATAGAEVGYGMAEVSVNIDPVFSFNQAAFDEIARAGGFPTFDLSRYYAFEYSAGAAPVPEPATGSLLLAGLAVVLAALRRRSLQSMSSSCTRSIAASTTSAASIRAGSKR